MVGHEAICVDRAAKAGGEGAQVIKISDVIFSVEETIVAIVPALDDMQSEFWDNETRCARHETANDTALGPVDYK